MADTDDEERRLRIELMVTQIDNLKADTTYKQRLAGWEPWKAVGVAFGAGAALMGALVALITLILKH